jgi:hypothetical protein
MHNREDLLDQRRARARWISRASDQREHNKRSYRRAQAKRQPTLRLCQLRSKRLSAALFASFIKSTEASLCSSGSVLAACCLGAAALLALTPFVAAFDGFFTAGLAFFAGFAALLFEAFAAFAGAALLFGAGALFLEGFLDFGTGRFFVAIGPALYVGSGRTRMGNLQFGCKKVAILARSGWRKW